MIPFFKYEGTGNDFVLIDAIQDQKFPDPTVMARAMCSRRYGVGSDGLIFLKRLDSGSLRMEMWNPDGTSSEMCGNGIRCVGLFAKDHSYWDGATALDVDTDAGKMTLELLDQSVKVDMGAARFYRNSIGAVGPSDEPYKNETLAHSLTGIGVSMGNPHLVIFVPDLDSVPLEAWGPELERHPDFPNRVNVHFAQIISRASLRMKTWERGAGATLACGTGACATAAAAIREGLCQSPVETQVPGGKLTIEINDDGRVHMTGPAHKVFDGYWGS